MPLISEDSFFFTKVDTICHRPAITCPPGMGLVEMTRVMKEHNISGIVAVEGERPVGIVSLRDLRDLIAASVADIATLAVRDVMKTGLITIRCSDHLFKAIFLMAKHNIHRLVVVDDAGLLAGVLTDTDLLRVQARSPLYLVQEIEAAGTIEQLRLLSQKMSGMLQYAIKLNADPQTLIELIAYFNNAFTQRLIGILADQDGICLPEGAAYLALGSEGREEQTLRTDQDSAIVYCDDLSAAKRAEVRRFADAVVAGLAVLGVPLCPGKIMANNPDWCHSLSEWKILIEQWISTPGPDQTVNFGVFQDLRVQHGERLFEGELRAHISATAKNNSHFFPNMARNIVRFKPPIGMFSRLLVERRGEGRGKLDLKKGGLFALTRGISLIALEEGICGGTTWSKIERLRETAHMAPDDLDVLEESFTFLVNMRLEKQLRALAAGIKPSNYVDPLVLHEKDRAGLRAAFRGVNTLLHILQSRYQLNLVNH